MFDQVMARIAGRFRRVEPRASARSDLLGLLSGVERKNCSQLADQAGHTRPAPPQHLLRYACWDADAGSPATVSLAEPARVAGVRCSVEECFQAAKSQLGLDHYQVRHWTSWHRYITLAMLALAFLTAVAADAAPQRPAGPHHFDQSLDPITLTVPERNNGRPARRSSDLRVSSCSRRRAAAQRASSSIGWEGPFHRSAGKLRSRATFWEKGA
ncbi:hypothetical protein ACFRU3_39985 [Streptomyces sp. NPDC056910]|uniref:hypothetical protein n=1 Tax=Streptomyces sp. NPDC056910 TaxID=3345964 RepID=UPI0036AE3D0A